MSFTQLGSGMRPIFTPEPPSDVELLLQAVLDALGGLQLQAPQIVVEQPPVTIHDAAAPIVNVTVPGLEAVAEKLDLLHRDISEVKSLLSMPVTRTVRRDPSTDLIVSITESR